MPTPTTSSLYVMTSTHAFIRTATTDNVVRYRSGATGTNHPLAENITRHSFALPTLTTSTLPVRMKSIDPATK